MTNLLLHLQSLKTSGMKKQPRDQITKIEKFRGCGYKKNIGRGEDIILVAIWKILKIILLHRFERYKLARNSQLSCSILFKAVYFYSLSQKPTRAVFIT